MDTPVTQTTSTISTVEMEKYKDMGNHVISSFVEWYNINNLFYIYGGRDTKWKVNQQLNEMIRTAKSMKVQLNKAWLEANRNFKLDEKTKRQQIIQEKKRKHNGKFKI